MFGLKKVNTEKMRVKILATLLILTLTFANLALLGSYLGKSIAVGIDLSKQGYETNSENVKFDVSLDANNREIKEQTAEIGSELPLTISVSVQGEGYLKNPIIQFINSNFELRDNPQIEMFKLNDINTNQGSTVTFPIVIKDTESFNLNMLNGQTEIKLTGEYTDSKGNVIDIDSTKAVKINWTANELTEENIELGQEVITNRIYDIDGENKRVVQLLITSRLKDNIAPVKSNTIEISNPQIDATPTEVTVSAYTTNATNQKTSIEFGDGESSTYQYKPEEEKTYIKVLNNANAENAVAWAKNSRDEFVVTYIYDESVQILPFISDVKNTVEVYGKTGTIEKTNEITLQELNQYGDIARIENSITNSIYKGKMYIGEDTNYETASKIYIPYNKLVNSIKIEDLDVEMPEGLSTYYKTTRINKKEAIKVLGAEGTITIYNAVNKETPIKEISLSEETEDEYYTISYEENVNKILIEMSTAKAEGTISIINEKAIQTLNTEIVGSVSELKSNTKLSITDANNTEIVNSNNETTAVLIEPKTDFNVSLDKNSISTAGENSIKITAELMSKNESNKLFTDPTLYIELPAEVTEANIESITPVVGGDVLAVKSSNIVTNEAGLKVIVVEFQGQQTKYTSNTPTVAIDVKLKTSAFLADREVELKSTIINNGESVQKVCKLQIKSKTGLITKSTVKVGEAVVEKVNQNTVSVDAKQNDEVEINSSIINNYEDTLLNEAIIGNIPATGTLRTAVTTNVKNAIVYYSEEANAQKESDSWNTQPQSLEKVRSFKIEGANLEVGEQIEVAYKYALNENALSMQESTLKVSGTVNEIAKEETLKYIASANQIASDSTVTSIDGIEMAMTPKTTTNTFYEEQIVTYDISVKNTTGLSLDDVVLEYSVPEGAVLTELTYAQGNEMTYTDDSEQKTSQTWEFASISPKETKFTTVSIKVKKGTHQITNKIALKKNSSEIASLTTDPVEVIQGDLTVNLSRIANKDVMLGKGGYAQYIVLVKNNTKGMMNNVTLRSKIPNGVSFVSDSESGKNWTYDAETGEISCVIDKIDSGETIEKGFDVKVDKIPDNVEKTIIDNTAVAVYNEKEYESNVYTSTVLQPVWKIEMSSDSPETLNVRDNVTYTINVKNETSSQYMVNILDDIPEEIYVYKISYTGSVLGDKDINPSNNIELYTTIDAGKTLTVEIKGTVLDIDDDLASKEITNIAKIKLDEEKYLESNAINKTIMNDYLPETNDNEELDPGYDPDEDPNGGGETDPGTDPGTNPGTDPGTNPGGGNNQGTDPGGDPNGGEETNPGGNSNGEGTNPGGNPEQSKNSISGLAWLDENKNGIKDTSEELIQAINVVLLDADGNKVDETKTSLAGTYKFADIEKGDYTIAFEYDTSKYAVTKYQASNATDETNSDAISKQIEIDKETVNAGVTDTIKLQDKDITNIDIGLIQNAKFDLRLDKYVSKVVVTNDAGTSTYEYENTKLAKVEISAKKIAGTVIMVEYDLKVTNEGDVDAYVGDMVDYLPDGFVFTSETNKDWYMDGNKMLHNKTLAEQVLKPGETKTVTLVLNRTLKEDSTGTTENIGEIGESNNTQGLKEFDSVAGNKQASEDDLSKASLIVSIATGSPVMYFGIVIGTMLVLGLGIYLINKKVLNVDDSEKRWYHE